MPITEVSSPAHGIIGYLHEVECQGADSILIFQLPRATKHLSDIYVGDAKKAIISMLPPGRNALIIGCDVNVYELAGPDAVVLRLKGLI